jgi:hypothetical protein
MEGAEIGDRGAWTLIVFGDMLRKVMSSTIRWRSGEIGLFIA